MVWEQQFAVYLRLAKFVVSVRKGFDSPLSGREDARKLLQLHQDARSVVDYAADFHTLVAESAWNPKALFNMFLHGLSELIKDELAARELPMDLDSLIALTIPIDGWLRERRRERESVPCPLRSPSIPTSTPRNAGNTFHRDSDVTRVLTGI